MRNQYDFNCQFLKRHLYVDLIDFANTVAKLEKVFSKINFKKMVFSQKTFKRKKTFAKKFHIRVCFSKNPNHTILTNL